MCVVWVGLLASGSARISLSLSPSSSYIISFVFFSFLSYDFQQSSQQTTAVPIKFHALFCSVLCRVSCYWRRVTRERKFRSRIQSTTAITDTIEWRLSSTAWENLTGVWSAVVIHIYTDAGPAAVELENWDRVKRRGSPNIHTPLYITDLMFA